MQTLLSALALAATNQLPKVSDYLNDPGWQSLVNNVASNDRTFLNSDVGIRDPKRQFEMFGDGEFKQLPANRRDLALMQLFHTPPSTPQIDSYPVIPQNATRARWLGYKRTDLPRRPTSRKRSTSIKSSPP